MTTDWRVAAFRAALRAIEGGAPKSLITRAAIEAEETGKEIGASDLAEVIEAEPSDGAFLAALGMQVHKWDAATSDVGWAGGTEPSTQARRDRVCALLGLDARGAGLLLERRPIFHDHTIVITAPWARWYTPERALERAFYWPSYQRYLLERRGWPVENVTSLDLASTDVVERIADPTRPEAYQSKGLVVGYVQSGKTANFTAVVAKAIDAGYRLVIVMTGTIELLRSQTQRRLDMELCGRPNILGDIPEQSALQHKLDYADDIEWLAGRFNAHDGAPLPTEIRRLTQHHEDYKNLGAQFQSLKIERAEPGLPLYDPANLFKAQARLAIVKKNSQVLAKLVANITANQSAFTQIPVLIIDDESDEASPNTVDPEKVADKKRQGVEVEERKAVNARIAELLELLPRAQYVGYTATPFANVFADPSDPLGIFPKDFVISLPRPPGYMGVDDFLDAQEDGEGVDGGISNSQAFVRDLQAEDEDLSTQNGELRRAIDHFVLAGAVKLWRETVDGTFKYRHHTMLVHQSVKKNDHREVADRVKRLWRESEFSQAAGKKRLQELYNSDVMPVSAARAEDGIPPAPPFAEIVDHIPAALARITEHDDNPVLVINSDTEIEQQKLDFDKESTWRILVGGTKLSRGFTVEGLTVTYFRRATDMNASLTQMGRWFGFRAGYRDLVRLYIARRARFGRKVVDLREAFEGVALDEAAFRGQLEQYAAWEDDRPRLLPSQIPPLVTQHLVWLRPVAKNKMFNAIVTEQGEQPFTPTGYPNDADLLKENLDLWRPVFTMARDSLTVGAGRQAYSAFTGVVDAGSLVGLMEHADYLPLFKERVVAPRVAFYRRLIEDGDLRDFVVVIPQPQTSAVELADVGPLAVVSRDRRAGRHGRFGETTDPHHRRAVEAFVAGSTPASTGLGRYLQAARGAVLLYLARETKPDYDRKPKMSEADPEFGLVAAFSAYVPDAALSNRPNVIQFSVRVVALKDDATVEAAS